MLAWLHVWEIKVFWHTAARICVCLWLILCYNGRVTVATETISPLQSNIFTVWPFKNKVADPCSGYEGPILVCFISLVCSCSPMTSIETSADVQGPVCVSDVPELVHTLASGDAVVGRSLGQAVGSPCAYRLCE